VRAERWVLAVAMLLPAALAAVYFVALSPGAAGEPRSNPVMQAAYATCKVVQFAIPVLWLVYADPSALRVCRVSTRGVGVGVAFGLLVAVAAFALYRYWLAQSPVFADVPDRIRAKVGEFGITSRAGFTALAVFIAGVHSFLEEYYWRWFVYGRLRRHVPVAAALVIAGLAFMGHHVVVLSVYFPGRFWPAVLPFSLAVAAGGVVWAWLYERTGSLVGPWVSHLIVDAALMLIGYDLAFGRG